MLQGYQCERPHRFFRSARLFLDWLLLLPLLLNKCDIFVASTLPHSLECPIRLNYSRLNAPQKVHVHISKVYDIELLDSSRCDGLVVSILIEFFCFGVQAIYI